MSDLVKLLRSNEPIDWWIIKDAADRIEELEAALRFYASDDVWRLNGYCDPNSPRFEGPNTARAALAPQTRDETDDAK